MRRFTAAVAASLGLGLGVALVPGAAAAVQFGANDDSGKYADDGGSTFFAEMAEAGLKQNVMTVRWEPRTASELSESAFLDSAVPTALESGVDVVLAVYPYPPSAIEAGLARPAVFAEWLTELAHRYPQIKTYIVGNEPNLNTFWRPQGDGKGTILSGASFGPFLAAGYDALKAVSPDITVLGVGSSPRGDRAPGPAGKASPVHFLKSLGDWYRSSRRPAPLMDGFSFHPYPKPSDFTVPFTFAYGWPNASVQELPRIKQALWDAFNGTAQRTTVNGLRLYLDEVGWQVDTTGWDGYTGYENVRVATEAAQALVYGQLVRYVVCDPDVAQLNFFGYYDERDRGGWQAALRRVDGSARPAHDAVATAIRETGGTCSGALRTWSPLRRPDAAAVSFASYRGSKAKQRRSFGFLVTASEDVTVRAGLVPAATPAARIPALLASAGAVDAYRKPAKTVVASPAAGRTVLAVLVSAKMNPARTTLFRSPVFTVAAPQPSKLRRR